MKGHAALLAILAAPVLCVAAPAYATPKVSGDDHRVVVEVTHAEWSGAPARAVGDAVEIPLLAGADSMRVDFDDRTVKRISVTNTDSPSLFIRLHHSKGSTERTAEQLKIEKLSGGIKVSFPREPVRPEGVEPKPAVAKTVESQKPTAKVEPVQAAKPAPAPAAPKSEPLAVTTVVAGLTAAPSRAASERQVPKPANKPAAPEAGYATSSAGGARVWSTLLLICLGAAGLLAMIFRKKNGSGIKEEIFRVVGAHSLGGKSKLVLVDVQDRKFLLAVDDKATRVVGSWTGDDKPRVGTEAGPTELGALLDEEARDDLPSPVHFRDDEDLPARPRRTMLSGATSPAVAGLMKLRERHALSEDVQSGDPQADDEWASMLLRATNKRAHS